MKVKGIEKQYENIRCWNIKLPVRAVIAYIFFLLLLKLVSVSLNILNLVQNFIIVSSFIYFIMHMKPKIALFC